MKSNGKRVIFPFSEEIKNKIFKMFGSEDVTLNNGNNEPITKKVTRRGETQIREITKRAVSTDGEDMLENAISEILSEITKRAKKDPSEYDQLIKELQKTNHQP